MPTTGSGQFPYPNSSAVPDVPADVLLLAQRVDKMASGWTVCADATARAALVTNGDAYEGLHVYQIDTKITYLYLSSAWKAWSSDWISYTPTNTGYVLGSGGSFENTGSYKYVDGMVHVIVKQVFGSSGTTFPTTPSFTLPVTAATPSAPFKMYLSAATFWDTSASAVASGFVAALGSSTTEVRYYLTGATYGLISTTNPFTWAAGDILTVEFTYRPA